MEDLISRVSDPFYDASEEEILAYRDAKKDQDISVGEGVEIVGEAIKSVVSDLGKGVMDFVDGASIQELVGSTVEGTARGTMDMGLLAAEIDERVGGHIQNILVENTKVPSMEQIRKVHPDIPDEEAEGIKSVFEDRAYINRFRFRQNALRHRELARRGEDNLVPFIDMMVSQPMAEATSVVADATSAFPALTGGKLGARALMQTAKRGGQFLEKAGDLAKAPQRGVNWATDKALEKMGMADTPELGRATANTATQAALGASINPAFSAPAIAYAGGVVAEQAGRLLKDSARVLDSPSLKDGVLKRAAVQGAGGAVEGIAIGGALGWAADGAAGFYSGIGTGGALGAGMGTASAVIRPNIAARTEADARGYLNSKSPEQGQLISEFAKSTDDIARAAHLEALFPQVRAEYIHPDNWQHGDTPGFYNTDTKNIEIRADQVGDPSIISEEIFHALANSEEMGKPISDLHKVLFGTPDAEGGYTGGLYSKDERAALHEQYKTMIPDDARARIDALRQSDDPAKALEYNQLLDEEIMAAHFRSVMSGSETPKIAQRFGGLKTRIADYMLKGNSVRAVNQFLNGQTALGSTPLSIKGSLDADIAVRDIMRFRQKVKSDLNFTEPGGLTITRNDLTGPDAEVYYNLTKHTGIWETNPDGTVMRGANGRPKLKTDSVIRKEEKQRNLYIEGALAKVDGTGGMQPITSDDGKPHYVGPGFNEDQVNAIMGIPENILPASLKERILKANDALDKWGDQLQIFYHARSQNHRPTWGVAPRWRSIAPYAMAISKDKNVRVKTIDMDAIDIKVDKYLKKKGKQDLFEAWGGRDLVDVNEFKRDVFHVVQDRAAGTRAIEGMKSRGQSDSAAAQRVEAIDRFLNAKGETRAKGEVLFRDFRVDQIEKFVPLPDAQKFPWHHDRAAAKFAPARPDDLWGVPKQEISSADTSINSSKLPSTFTKVKTWEKGSVNVDLGGGRFDNVTKFLKTKGVENHIFDPFNRDSKHNKKVADKVLDGGADTATINKVLNVIKEKANRERVIAQARDALKGDGTAYFLIDEGPKSKTKPEATSKGWQNNWEAQKYVGHIKEHFGDVTRKGNLIIAKKPKDWDVPSPARPDFVPENIPDGDMWISQGRSVQGKNKKTGQLNPPKFDEVNQEHGITHDLFEEQVLGKKSKRVVVQERLTAEHDLVVKDANDDDVVVGKTRYPLREKDLKDPTTALRVLKQQAVDNILWLHDKVSDLIRKRSKLWYDGARRIIETWSDDLQIPKQAIAGVLALMSPQKDWFQNVALANRLITVWKFGQNSPWTKEMEARAKKRSENSKDLDAARKRIKVGDKLKDLPVDLQAVFIRIYSEVNHPRSYNIVTPEGDKAGIKMRDKNPQDPQSIAWGSFPFIESAIEVLNNPTKEVISEKLGTMHKIRNFYNNMLLPTSTKGDITADTHAINVSLLMPMGGSHPFVNHGLGQGFASSPSNGINGLYGLHADAYREAASQRGLLAREMQSITWEAVRGLFTDVQKRDKNFVLKINKIWDNYSHGKISLAAAREKVFNAAGGIVDPDWIQHPATDVGAGRSSYQGEIYRDGNLGGTEELGSGGRHGNAKRSPSVSRRGGIAHTQSPINSRGGVLVKFATGHTAVRVSGKNKFKVFSPLKKYLGLAKNIEDVEDLLMK